MWPVWPYLTPALTALYLGNQNPPKKFHMALYGPLRLVWRAWALGSAVNDHEQNTVLFHYFRGRDRVSPEPLHARHIRTPSHGHTAWHHKMVSILTGESFFNPNPSMRIS
jgi:hypothetical protein